MDKKRINRFVSIILCIALSASLLISEPYSYYTFAEEQLLTSPSNIESSFTSDSISLKWDLVASATGYDIEVDGAVLELGEVNAYIHSDLSPNTSHQYRVRAKNQTETSDWSSLITVSTLAQLSIPENLIAGSYSENSILLKWDLVANATGYDIEVDGAVLDLEEINSYTHGNLSPNTSHQYRVRAKNLTEISDWSNLITVTTLIQLDTPLHLAVDSYSENSITIKWDAINGAEGYEVEADGVVIDAGAATVYTHSELQENTSHVYKIRAKNGQAVSPWSESITVTNTIELPIPQNLSIVKTSNKVTVFWNSVAEASGYDIEVDGIVFDAGNLCSFEHNDLIPESNHIYRVRARVGERFGDWSTPISATLSAPLAVPQGIDTSRTGNSITIMWGTVNQATSYDIEIDGVISHLDNNTSYTHTGLTIDSNHIYRLRARNNDEASEWSQIIDIPDFLKGEWVNKASMKTARYDLATAELGGKIYAIGGYNTAVSSVIEEYNPETNAWTTKASMPTARTSLGAAAVNGKIYAIGGYTTTYSKVVEEYNPQTNSWTTKTAMPTARRDFGIAVYDGKIYVIGGQTSSGPTNKVEMYDPATNKWTSKTGMGISRYYLGAETIGGKIYAIAGYSGGLHGKAIEEYDPVTDQWTRRGSLFTSNYRFGMAAYDGKIYLVGGETVYSVLEAYDQSESSFTRGVSMPTLRYGNSAEFINGRLYVIGGYGVSGTLDKVEMFIPITLQSAVTTPANILSGGQRNSISLKWDMVQPATSYDIEANGTIIANVTENSYIHADLAANTVYTYRIRAKNILGTSEWSSEITQGTVNSATEITGEWTSKANLQTARYEMGIESLNGKIYAIGGYGTAVTNIVEEYNPSTDTWLSKRSMTTARRALGAVAANGKIYAIGGYATAASNMVEEYDAETNKWTTKAAMPTARYGLGIAEIDGKIYAVGGYASGGATNKLEVYNPTTNAWETKSSMSTARYNLGVAVVNGRLYAIGGNNGKPLNTIEEYNPQTDTWIERVSLLTANYEFGTTVYNDKIFIIGGNKAQNIVEEYDPIAGTFAIEANMPTERYRHGVIALDGKIYAIGGYKGSVQNKVEMFIPATQDNVPPVPGNIMTGGRKDSITLSWNIVQKATSYDIEADGVMIGNITGSTYTHSGLQSSTVHHYRIRSKNIAGTSEWSPGLSQTTVDARSEVTGEWATKANLKTARYNLGTAALNGKIYTIGGYTTAVVKIVEEYNPETDLWTSKTSMPTARRSLGAIAVNGKIYAIGGYTTTSTNVVEEYNAETDKWTVKATMPTARYGMGVAEINGKIYAVGGYASSAVTNVLEVYNPATNTWETKASMPTARHSLGVEVIDGKLYAIGGYTSKAVNTIEEYDPETNIWTEKVSLLKANYNFGTVVYGNKIFLIGGTSSSNTVEEYDPLMDTFAEEASMPTARNGLGTALVGDKIYAIGGYKSTVLNKVEVFIPAIQDNRPMMPENLQAAGNESSITLNWDVVPDATSYEIEADGNVISNITGNSYSHSGLSLGSTHQYRIRSKNIAGVSPWSPMLAQNTFSEASKIPGEWGNKTSLGTARYNLGATVLNGKIYAVGGYTNAVSNIVEEYNPITNKWTNKAVMPTARRRLGVIASNGNVYAIGGYTTAVTNIVEEYNPVTDLWVTKAAMPTARYGMGMAELNGKIYVIGGYAGKATGQVEVYDTATNLWSTKTAMPTPRYNLGVEVINGKLYAIGGYNGSAVNTVEEYNPETDTWVEKVSLLTPNYEFGTVVYQNKVIVVGGNPASSLMEIYEPESNTFTKAALGMPTARYGLDAVMLEGKIYALGGYKSGVLSNVEVFIPATPENIPNIPENITVGGVKKSVQISWDTVQAATSYEIEIDGTQTINVTGTQYVHSNLGDNSIHKYRIRSKNIAGTSSWSPEFVQRTVDPGAFIPGQWVTINGINSASHLIEATIEDNKIYTLVGSTSNNNYVIEYDPQNDSYNEKTYVPTLRSYLGAVSINQKIYAIGGGTASALTNVVEEYDLQTSKWTTKAGMSVARKDFGIAVCNGKIYVAGGYAAAGASNAVEEYDPETNIWTMKSNMPTPRYGLKLININNKLYAIGGFTNTYSNAVEEYDPATNQWTSKPSLLIPRYHFGAVGFNNKIYIIGGSNENNYLNMVEAYDPATNTFVTESSMVVARSGLEAVELNGKIYALGGSNGASVYSAEEFIFSIPENTPGEVSSLRAIGAKNAVELSWKKAMDAASYEVEADGVLITNIIGTTYKHGGLSNASEHKFRVRAKNINGVGAWSSLISQKTADVSQEITGNWIAKANMLTARSYLSMAALDGKIYAVGGSTKDGVSRVVEVYDPATNTWTKKADMLRTRSRFGLAAVNGKLYAIGGDPNANTMEEYDPVTDKWTLKSSFPTYKIGLATAVYNNKIYLFGNLGGSDPSVRVYDPITDKWDINGDMGISWFDLSALVIDDKIYLTGGTLVPGGATNAIKIYDPVSCTVEDYTFTTPTIRTFSRAAAINDKIFVMGGTPYITASNAKTVEQYDTKENTYIMSPDMITDRWNFGIVAIEGKIYVAGGYNEEHLNKFEVLNLKVSTNKSPVPANIQITSAKTDKITLKWDSVIDATGYEIEADGVVVSNNLNTTYTHTSLTPGTEHKYRIRSKNIAGPGNWSQEIVISTVQSAYSFSCNLNEIFDVNMLLSDIKDLSQTTFTINYDTSQVELIDIVSSTFNKDLSGGKWSDCDVYIVQNTQGKFVFEIKKTIPDGQAWFGVANSIRFKSKINGNVQITFTIK